MHKLTPITSWMYREPPAAGMAPQAEGAQMCAPIFQNVYCKSTLDPWEVTFLLTLGLSCHAIQLSREVHRFPCSHCAAPAQKPEFPTLSSDPIVPQPRSLQGTLGAAAPSNPSSHDFCNMSPLPMTLCFPFLQGGEASRGPQSAFWPKPTVRP